MDYDRDGNYLDSRAKLRYEAQLRDEAKEVHERVVLDFNDYL